MRTKVHIVIMIGMIGACFCLSNSLNAATEEQLKNIAIQEKALEEASEKYHVAQQNERKFYNQYKEYGRIADDYLHKSVVADKAIEESDAAAYKEKHQTRRNLLPSVAHVKRIFSSIGTLSQRKYYKVQWERYRDKEKEAEKEYNKARYESKKLGEEVVAFRRGFEEAKKKANVTEAKRSRRKEREEKEFFRMPDEKKESSQRTSQSQKEESPPKFVNRNNQKTNKEQSSASVDEGNADENTRAPEPPPSFVGKSNAGNNNAGQSGFSSGKGEKDDYRIVSMSVETTPVTYGKQSLQKLKSINAAVIVIEMRGEQHIIEGQKAVSILIEKGYFYNFPDIGIIATTKYNEFGGYNERYAGDTKPSSSKDDECGARLQECYRKWGRNLKFKKGENFRKMSSDEYWGRGLCAQLEERCQKQTQSEKQSDKRSGSSFNDKMITFEASEQDAETYGGAVLPGSQ